MKFGKQLRENLLADWKFYYIDYDGLKAFLYERTRRGYTASDEAEFVQRLEGELDKVFNFQQAKATEVKRLMENANSQIKLISETEAPQEAKAEQLSVIEASINKIISEVNELAIYTRMNFTGFIKIVKKHDKNAPFVLKPAFTVQMNNRPFFKENFDELLIELSRLYDVVRNGGQDVNTGKDPQAGNGQNFVRNTTKYWVHPDNVMELKLYILKHLPVLIYNAKGGLKPPCPAITSIYYDNDNLDLYRGRLEKSEGAEAIRLRWYGDMNTNEIFVERKTHHEDWTGEKSVKERFPIKEKYVNTYMSGEFTMEKKIQKMREEGKKSESDLNDMEELSSEVQSSVLTKGLKPMVRTFYNRTAFQLPGDARVRISLDTELTMIREDNLDGHERSGLNWRRMDIGVDYPFPQLPESDVCRFPYAVLEVKLQTQAGVEPPSWVTNLVESHLVEAVPKFSKFIHGVSTLLEERVDVLPFWFSQMDRDIRKPPTHNLGICRPDSTRNSYADLSVAQHIRGENQSQQQGSTLSRNPSDSGSQQGIEVVVKPRGAQTSRTGSSGRRNFSGSQQYDDYDDEQGEIDDEDTALLGSTSSGHHSYFDRKHQHHLRVRKNPLSWIFSGLTRLHPMQQLHNSTTQYNTGTPSPDSGSGVTFQAREGLGPNKRIAIPVRVEPKVFFANERTFLSWLNFSIVLGSLALGLLNFGDTTSRVAGAVFTMISMVVMIYALFLFQWRADRIRKRDPNPYDDRLGPTLLVFALFAAVMLNFYLKFTHS
ncbi:hypothetical protein H4219_003246 [Mycoemilia scoparia]|uniref:Vacuolar transporter chaperone complex subunit 4 n=1 Tax=Mycoemilia scoparia TaxID=417184 RepID=A0A9W8A3B9_9FUNG|nr:hypothetical protein H4219_003246 [Mycoemilia scoparia]